MRKKYKKDFLYRVIVRADFDTPIPIPNTGLSTDIYSIIKEIFPLTVEKKEIIISQDNEQKQQLLSREWHYYGKNHEKQLVISKDFASIEYNKYEYYETLSKDFNTIIEAIFKTYPQSQLRRLGLRYIDNIDLNRILPMEDKVSPMEWDDYIKPELNTILKLDFVKNNINNVSRSFSILEFNHDEYSLRFQFGMFNPDYPAIIKRKVYTLDYDIYTTKLLERKDVKETLDFFHETVNNFFEETITDGLRNIMEEKADER